MGQFIGRDELGMGHGEEAFESAVPSPENASPSKGEAPADAVEALLAELLGRPPEEREAALTEALARRPDLAADLRARIAWLQDVGLWAEAEPEVPADAASPPERLGDFRLIERLGGGGMGVVYLAEQVSLGRRVALKVVRPEQLFFAGARARFRRETEAVARLKHPGIAAIYVVGEDAGLPYFAMEWIEGATLAEILSELAGRAPATLAGSDLAAALESRAHGSQEDPSDSDPRPCVDRSAEVFGASWVDACALLARDVAEALEHAHGRGIIHRDVKPSNIVLGLDGRPRLLDFGLTSSEAYGRLTRSGVGVGTLYYTPPEQLRDAHSVDRTADVYALGVTLYELLTLRVPFQGANALATQRLIGLGRPPPIRARNRSVPPEAEIVCATAMDLDPSRRYASAAALARDLGNVIRRLPIEAQPPGPLLRARRWAQRNPALAAAVGVSLIAAAVVPSALLWQRSAHALELEGEQAKTEVITEESRQVEQFLGALIETADPFSTATPTVAGREVLDGAAARLDADLAQQPLVRARLAMALGRAYQGQGYYPESSRMFERAGEIFRAELGASSLEAFDADASLSWSKLKLGELDLAETLARGALEAFVEEAGPEHAQVRILRQNLAAVLLVRQRYAEAQPELELARDAIRREPGAPVDHQVGILVQIGECQEHLGELDAAEQSLREAVSLARSLLPAGRSHLASALNGLGTILENSGRIEEARRTYEEALECARQVLGRHDEVATILSNLADLELARLEFESAEVHLREAQEIYEEKLDPRVPGALFNAFNLAQVHIRAEELDEAEAVLQPLIERVRQVLGPRHSLLGAVLMGRARCMTLRRSYAEAEPLYLEALDIFLEAFGEEDIRTCQARSQLSVVYLKQGRWPEMEPLLLRNMEIFDAIPDLNHPNVEETLDLVVKMYAGWGKAEDAEFWRQRFAE